MLTFLLPLFPILASTEYALVNILRHAERGDNVSDPHLTIDGSYRAEYIGRCIAGGGTSLAFPLGPPQHLLASQRNTSMRPLETLTPLSRRLKLPVNNAVQMADVDGFVGYLTRLKAGETLLVAWQHWFIPKLIEAIDPRELAPRHFPKSCNFSQWEEPAYTNDACYDEVWQMMLYRSNSSYTWRVRAFTKFHMGYGGSAASPCEAAFSPHSNPSAWNLAEHQLAERSRTQGIAESFSTILICFASVCVLLALGLLLFSWHYYTKVAEETTVGNLYDRLLVV